MRLEIDSRESKVKKRRIYLIEFVICIIFGFELMIFRIKYRLKIFIEKISGNLFLGIIFDNFCVYVVIFGYD